MRNIIIDFLSENFTLNLYRRIVLTASNVKKFLTVKRKTVRFISE